MSYEINFLKLEINWKNDDVKNWKSKKVWGWLEQADEKTNEPAQSRSKRGHKRVIKKLSVGMVKYL